MSLTLRCQAAPPKPGTYFANLISVQEVAGAYDRPALKWLFATEDGAETAKVTGTELIDGTSLHKLVEALNGSPVVAGEQVDLHEFIGKRYEIVVAPANGGASVAIASIRPIEAA